MNFSMSAATLSASFINNYYDFLIITQLNLAKNRAILPSFPAVTKTPGDIATPLPLSFYGKKQVALYKQTNCNILKVFDRNVLATLKFYYR